MKTKIAWKTVSIMSLSILVIAISTLVAAKVKRVSATELNKTLIQYIPQSQGELAGPPRFRYNLGAVDSLCVVALVQEKTLRGPANLGEGSVTVSLFSLEGKQLGTPQTMDTKEIHIGRGSYPTTLHFIGDAEGLLLCSQPPLHEPKPWYGREIYMPTTLPDIQEFFAYYAAMS